MKPTPAEWKRLRALYEDCIDAAERIPFEWLVDSLSERRAGRRAVLVVAHKPRGGGRCGPILGFFFGVYVARYGGYGSYIAVDPRARGRGVGTVLFKGLFTAMRRIARRRGQRLPFVLWDSRAPRAEEAPPAWANWVARLRLFAKVGGRRVTGIEMATPNYADPLGPPVMLQLFLRPFDDVPEDFDADRLRRVVAGLLRNVYRLRKDDPLIERATLPSLEYTTEE